MAGNSGTDICSISRPSRLSRNKCTFSFDQFYKYVGLSPPQLHEEAKAPKKRAVDAATTSAQGSAPKKNKKDPEPAVKSRIQELRDLYERRCKKCSLCVKPTCKKCSTCKRNSSASKGQRIVCYQKVCRHHDPSWFVPAYLVARTNIFFILDVLRNFS